MTPLARLFCVLTLIGAAVSAPAQAVVATTTHGDGAASLSVAVETASPPSIDRLDISGLEPYVFRLLPGGLRDIAEFGPLVPDPAPLAVFGCVLILMAFLRRYLFL